MKFEKDRLPKRWIRARLENCVDILDSKRVPINSNRRKQKQGNIPYYGSTGQVGWIDDHLFDEELVLLGEDAAPFLDRFKDKAYLVSGKSWVNNHAHVLKGIENIILNNFLCYFLNQFDYHEYVAGTTRLKLNQSRMKEISLMIPPLNEQKRIVSKIESIVAQIDATQKKLEKLVSQSKSISGDLSILKSSVLKQVLEMKSNFERNELEHLTLFSKNGFTGRPNHNDEGTPRLGIETITSSNSIFINESKCKFIDISLSKKKNYETKKGDLFFCRQNGNKNNVGKCKVFKNINKSIIFSDSLIQFRISGSKKIIPEYLAYFVNSSLGRCQIDQYCFTTAGNFSINGTNLKKILIGYPPLPEQHRIVSKIESIFSKIDAVWESVNFQYMQKLYSMIYLLMCKI